VVCATNAALTKWGEPEVLFPVNFWKGLPYDPIAPWKDEDGRWYATIALDACNASGHAAGSRGTPVGKPFPDGGFCARGGELDLWTSPAMHGPKANWTHIAQPMFVSAEDVLPQTKHTDEFVTPNFFGGIPGDPRSGRTRVLTNNAMADNGTTEYYIGLQANGSAFDLLPLPHSVGMGMLDWGAFSPNNASSRGLMGLSASQSRGQSMCRTLGSEGGNQVARLGRRVVVCWLGLANSYTEEHLDPFKTILNMQGLPRDISLSPETELLQQFVPELKRLRQGAPTTATKMTRSGDSLLGAMGPRLEITCAFSVAAGHTPSRFGISVLRSPDGAEHTDLVVDRARGYVLIDGTKQHTAVRAGPFLPAAGNGSGGPTVVWMHAVIDACVVEVIWNNRTALTTQVVPSANTSTGIALFGVGGGVTAHLTAWRLAAANNTMYMATASPRHDPAFFDGTFSPVRAMKTDDDATPAAVRGEQCGPPTPAVVSQPLASKTGLQNKRVFEHRAGPRLRTLRTSRTPSAPGMLLLVLLALAGAEGGGAGGASPPPSGKVKLTGLTQTSQVGPAV
jgi:hypothetical protein